MIHFVYIFTAPTKLQEGDVFTPVCLTTEWVSAKEEKSLSRWVKDRDPGTDIQWKPLKRVALILLKYILVMLLLALHIILMP